MNHESLDIENNELVPDEIPSESNETPEQIPPEDVSEIESAEQEPAEERAPVEGSDPEAETDGEPEAEAGGEIADPEAETDGEPDTPEGDEESPIAEDSEAEPKDDETGEPEDEEDGEDDEGIGQEYNPEDVLGDDSSDISQDEKAALRKRLAELPNLWNDESVPHTGWSCTETSDLGAPLGVCEMCGSQIIRYVHHMTHPDYRDLDVGCICAGRMEGDIENAKRRERELKRKKRREEKEKEAQEEPKKSAPEEIWGQNIKPYHERAYLLYGNAPSAAGLLDLSGTREFLNGLGFDGGELRQARLGKHFAERMNEALSEEGPMKMFCSYCGAEITGIDFSRLPDGRFRCNMCSRTMIRSKEELNEIYQRVLTHLDAFFGASLRTSISVEMLEERKLKKKLQRPLSEVDDKSLLILGVAVNRKGKYSVYLENALPRISAIATFAHELTHIWQYTHWETKKKSKKFPKLSPKARLLVYEGMAKWVEIQYLYLVGETSAAKREELHTLTREDEYGIGYRLYLEHYPISRDAMSIMESPFTTDSYPIS